MWFVLEYKPPKIAILVYLHLTCIHLAHFNAHLPDSGQYHCAYDGDQDAVHDSRRGVGQHPRPIYTVRTHMSHDKSGVFCGNNCIANNRFGFSDADRSCNQ